MTGCRTECHSLSYPEPAVLEVKIDRRCCQQPLQLYRELRAQGVRAVRFIPQLRAEDAELWGDFLCAIFHIWAREDIGRITITLFDETLRIWCGEPPRDRPQAAANSACFVCAWRRLCAGDDDPLCEGYRQFFVASAPCMRVMRDLRKQQRSPGELMPLLRAI